MPRKNKKKKEGKKKAKTHAKKIQQYEQRIEELRNELPESSDDEVDTSEESSDPDDEPTSRVRKVQSAKESRRESRVLAYAENITDNEVIESIKSAKIKKVRNNSGSSHVNAIISKDSDFRREKIEIHLLDTGAGVNLVGEDIIKDSGVKIFELKNKRKDTEASGNQLDIVGVCELFVKLNCVKKKKISCLVLRGKHVDREILISYETLLSWDLIHDTFGKETITSFVNRNNVKKIRNHVHKLKVKNSNSDLICKNPLSTN